MGSTERSGTATRRIRTAILAAVVAFGTVLDTACSHAPSTGSAHGRPQSPPPSPAAPGDRHGKHGALSPADGETQSETAGQAEGDTASGTVWPAAGQAAYLLEGQSQSQQPQIQAGPNQHPAPIASVAKVMTAYLVLTDHPLQAGQDGPAITLTAADAADTAHRSQRGESIVAVAAGERLTERQALQALLMP